MRAQAKRCILALLTTFAKRAEAFGVVLLDPGLSPLIGVGRLREPVAGRILAPASRFYGVVMAGGRRLRWFHAFGSGHLLVVEVPNPRRLGASAPGYLHRLPALVARVHHHLNPEDPPEPPVAAASALSRSAVLGVFAEARQSTKRRPA